MDNKPSKPVFYSTKLRDLSRVKRLWCVTPTKCNRLNVRERSMFIQDMHIPNSISICSSMNLMIRTGVYSASRIIFQTSLIMCVQFIHINQGCGRRHLIPISRAGNGNCFYCTSLLSLIRSKHTKKCPFQHTRRERRTDCQKCQSLLVCYTFPYSNNCSRLIITSF